MCFFFLSIFRGLSCVMHPRGDLDHKPLNVGRRSGI